MSFETPEGKRRATPEEIAEWRATHAEELRKAQDTPGFYITPTGALIAEEELTPEEKDEINESIKDHQ